PSPVPRRRWVPATTRVSWFATISGVGAPGPPRLVQDQSSPGAGPIVTLLSQPASRAAATTAPMPARPVRIRILCVCMALELEAQLDLRVPAVVRDERAARPGGNEVRDARLPRCVRRLQPFEGRNETEDQRQSAPRADDPDVCVLHLDTPWSAFTMAARERTRGNGRNLCRLFVGFVARRGADGAADGLARDSRPRARPCGRNAAGKARHLRQFRYRFGPRIHESSAGRWSPERCPPRMCYRHRFLAAAAVALTAVPPIAQGDDAASADRESPWVIGVAFGYGERSNPLIQSEDLDILVDIDVAWFGKRWFFDNGDVGYTLRDGERFTLNLIGRVNSDRVFFSKTDTDHVSIFSFGTASV